MTVAAGGFFNQPASVRLFIEEIACDLCRFQHIFREQIEPGAVRISREAQLPGADCFADILVELPDGNNYLVEVKYGYDCARTVRHILRKYGAGRPAPGRKLVLVVESTAGAEWTRGLAELRGALEPALPLEVWDEARLQAMIRELLGLDLDSLSAANLLDVREAIEEAKGRYAFGAAYNHSPLQHTLLWHLSCWQLRRLAETRGFDPRAILEPKVYREVSVVIADLCSFSGFVKDTDDDEVVADALTAFYSKSRDAILDRGGMLYQFGGDQVIGLFGVPTAGEEVPAAALACAQALVGIGRAIAHEWQRSIDRVQKSAGVHIGIAHGGLQLLSLRPFSRAHVGVIGDSINLAARLLDEAGMHEILASNSFYRALPVAARDCFTSSAPVAAKNIGLIQTWRSCMFGP